jgi:hypothetical protein
MTNNKQQTAVDFAFETLANQGLLVYKEYTNLVAYQEAKEMEKERTINFTEDWYFNGPLLGEGIDVKSTIEQHFNNTYGGGHK